MQICNYQSPWEVKSSNQHPLHTYRDERRGYTSTPTKIGGHCLDHIRNGLIVWERNTTASGGRSGGESTRLLLPNDFRGRFGGLCRGEDVVLKLTGSSLHPPTTLGRFSEVKVNSPLLSVGPRQTLARRSWSIFPPYPTPAELPPDTWASPLHGGDIMEQNGNPPGMAQALQQRYLQPWRGNNRNDTSDDSGRDGGSGGSSSGGGGGGGGATGHAGALMAVLLSQFASSTSTSTSIGGENRGVGEGTGAILDDNSAAATAAEVAEEGYSPPPASFLRSISGMIATLATTSTGSVDNLFAEEAAAAVSAAAKSDDASWAWNSRIRQTASYSKLRRYSFVRQLGRGSHGTILLVEKIPSRKLRVLKESSFLAEAVNEARLLLLAGGASETGGYVSGYGGDRGKQVQAAANADDGEGEVEDCEVISGDGWDSSGTCSYQSAKDSKRALQGEQRRDAARDVVGGSGGERCEQRGGVIQLHDFFVETLGHISLAFLELDYCDGGDLHELILASGRGDGDGETTHRDLLSTPTAFGSKSSGGIAKMGDDGGSREKGAGLPAEQIAKLTLGLLEGLQRLHERGVLHRDLKPGNVLLTKSGAVRIADLGVSTSLQPSRPLTEHAAGTIPFMAPEVRKFLLGSKVHYSGKADVWAVGALLYAMAIGDPAPAELSTAPRAELVSVVGHRTGSEGLSLVAHKVLDPDPAKRPSVHQAASMLQDYCRREGWLLHQTWSTKSKKKITNNRAPAAGFARL